jgi:hypothetical protein
MDDEYDENKPSYIHCNKCGRYYDPVTKILFTLSEISNPIRLYEKIEEIDKRRSHE